jgi:hypothetical protein
MENEITLADIQRFFCSCDRALLSDSIRHVLQGRSKVELVLHKATLQYRDSNGRMCQTPQTTPSR